MKSVDFNVLTHFGKKGPMPFGMPVPQAGALTCSATMPATWFSKFHYVLLTEFQLFFLWQNADSSERIIAPMRWGLVPSWFKDDLSKFKLNTSNCRSDTITEKRSFKVSG